MGSCFRKKSKNLSSYDPDKSPANAWCMQQLTITKNKRLYRKLNQADLQQPHVPTNT